MASEPGQSWRRLQRSRPYTLCSGLATSQDYLRLAVDVLYLDSAHEMRETFHELSAYWPLIKPGGILLGDDFNWMAVSHDAQLFARTHDLEIGSFDGCHERLRADKGGELCVWYLRKPPGEKAHGQIDRRPQRLLR